MTEAAGNIGATQTSLASTSALAALGDHRLIFVEACQAVYELDDLSAFVWVCLDAQLRPEQMVEDLVGAGVAQPQAREAVAAALGQLGELHRATSLSHAAAEPTAVKRAARLTLLICGVAVQLHVSKTLLAEVEAAFGYLATDVQETDVQLCLRSVGNEVQFLPPGRLGWSCERSHFISMLKAELIDSVLRSARYEVALHAAAVADGDGILLLVGSPGAGKSTLTIALAGSGYDVVSDDVVLVDHDGWVTGLPFSLTAKASGWSLISGYWPSLTFEPSYGRPDGQTVAYLHDIPLARPQSHRVKCILLLDRQDNVAASVHQIDPVHVLSMLIEEGATRDERMTAIGFKSLVDILQETRCIQLTYSDLPGAIDAVRSLNP